MSIMRIEHSKDDPYYRMRKGVVNDNTLSFKAKGILCYLLSKPENWTVRDRDLVNTSKDGWDSVRSGLKELRDAGYIRRVFKKNKGGLGKWERIVSDTPEVESTCIRETLRHVDPVSGEPCVREARRVLVTNDCTNINESLVNNDSTEAALAAPKAGSGRGGSKSFNGRKKNTPQVGEGLISKYETIRKDDKYDPFYIKCAEKFESALRKNGFTPGNTIPKTTMEGFRLLHEIDKVPKDVIWEMLLWFEKNCGRKKCPGTFTSQEFRKKWNNLKRARDSNCWEGNGEDCDIEKEIDAKEQNRINEETKKRMSSI